MPRTFFNEAILFFRGYRNSLRKGECYEQGKHVEKDIPAAITCYEQAISEGNIQAYVKLGQLYEKNEKIEDAVITFFNAALRPYQNAKENLLRLAERGIALAEYHYGMLSERICDWSNAQLWYQKAAEHFSEEAMYDLGLLYEEDRLSADGQVVIARNQPMALHWYKQAAIYFSKYGLDALLSIANQNALAALYLAQLYENGQGISKNMERAFEYYTQASDLENTDASFRLAQLYEINDSKNTEQSFHYYAIAARRGHSGARTYLVESSLKSENPSAQYALGAKLWHYENNLSEAVDVCMKAADQGHEAALKYLTETQFSSEIYRKIGRKYKEGDGVVINMSRSLEFYTKAAKCGDIDSAYFLGEVYELGQYLVEKNIQTSWSFYLINAKKGHMLSLGRLEQLATEFLDFAKRMFDIAQLYEVFNQFETAVKWYLKSAQSGHNASSSRLYEISEKNPDVAFIVGKAYQEGIIVPINKLESYIYFALGYRNNHVGSQHTLENAASEDPDAQYALGFFYYHYKKNINQAVLYCMRAAEKNHIKALNYLTTTTFPIAIYVTMAKKYEQGDGVQKQIEKTFLFYKKASDLGDAESAFRLGQLYEMHQAGLVADSGRAAENYLKAAKKGLKKAIPPLERLARKGNNSIREALKTLYKQFFSQDISHVVRWSNPSDTGLASSSSYTTSASRFFRSSTSQPKNNSKNRYITLAYEK